MRLLTLLIPFLCVTFSVSLISCEPRNKEKADKGLQTDFRLPNNSLPLRYELWLKTDVDKAEFNFSGRVKIHIKIVEATQLITLHYRRINFDNVDLLNVDRKVIANNLTFVSERFNFLDISLPQVMAANEEIVLDISYKGELLEKQQGFYRASYIKNNSSNATVWYATTQFEAVHARHAFPCYDEPAIRAVISVEIQHDKSYNAISNMPIISREEITGTDYVTSKFNDTPPMQTYLLAFIISDFTFISNNDTRIEQRIYAKPQSIDDGEGDFALSVVGPIIKKMEEHFGIDYPLPKMDHAAITNFKNGAMENSGLITYREEYLLFERTGFKATDKQNKEMIINVIAHEFAHQYFGNIVAPKWWSHLWLNEAFASFYSYYIPSLIYPEGNFMKQFQKDVADSAMETEIVEGSRPLSYHAETYFETIKCFDHIPYDKGGVFLRMFQEAMTVETFTKGLKYYLKAMYYSAATPEDLHRELQKAYDEDFPGNEINIGEAMKTWEDQAGYPIIHVEKSGNKFILTQQRHDVSSGLEIYTIPISYATKSDPNFENKTVKLWMKTKTVEIESSGDDNDWIILNMQSTGYYKTDLSESILKALAHQLETNHEKLPKLNKVRLLMDIGKLLEESKISAVYGFKILKYLKDEKDFLFWKKAKNIFSTLHKHLFGTSAFPLYQKFIQSLIKPHIDRLGFQTVSKEPEGDKDLRSLIMKLCKEVNQIECLNYELKRLEDFLATKTGGYDLCEGLKLASASVHSDVMEKFVNTSGYRKIDFVKGLGCSMNQEILQSNLNFALNGSSNLEENDRAAIMKIALTKNSDLMNFTLNLIYDNLYELMEIIPNKIDAVIKHSISYVNSSENVSIMKKLIKLWAMLKEMDYDQYEDSYDESKFNEVTCYTEQLAKNMKWTERNLKETENWINAFLL